MRSRPQAAAAVVGAAPPRRPGTLLALRDGGRHVDANLVLDGASVGWGAVETFATEKAARRAFAELRASLIEQGYEAE